MVRSLRSKIVGYLQRQYINKLQVSVGEVCLTNRILDLHESIAINHLLSYTHSWLVPFNYVNINIK